VGSMYFSAQNPRPTSLSKQPRDPKDAEDSSEEDSDEDSSEEESSDEDDARPNQGTELTREQRRAQTKARKEAAKAKQKKRPEAGDLPTDSEDEDDDDEDSDDSAPANPNHTAKARSQAAAAPKLPDEPAKAGTPGSSKGPAKKTDVSQLTRREREALQAQQSRERYQKLHAEGKTDEAKADLARLAVIKEKREQEAARKKAEAEEKAEREKERQEASNRERRMREAAMGSSAAKSGKGGKKK
jgi:hypothetical protein